MVFSTHDKTVRMVEFAVLTALTVILQLLCSVLTFGQISITLSLVPVVIGAALFGPGGGAILGFILGAVNFISSFFNPVLLFLFQASPVAYIITCFGKTVLAGAVAGLLYRVFREKHRYIGVTLAALSAPIVNTGVFFLMMIAFFQKHLLSFFTTDVITGSVAAFVITAFIGVNFLVEFGLNVVLCPAIARIIDVVRHTAKKNAQEEAPADAASGDGEENA